MDISEVVQGMRVMAPFKGKMIEAVVMYVTEEQNLVRLRVPSITSKFISRKASQIEKKEEPPIPWSER